MTRLDRYLLRESLPPFLFGLLLYSGLAVLSATLPRMQWVIGVPLAPLATWLVLQLPGALVQTLPIALLLAVLLTYGRLASEHELPAMQAGGVALRRLSAIFLLLGLASAGVALYLNEEVLPTTNARVGSLWWQLTSEQSGLARLVNQDIPLGDFTLHFERADSANDDLMGVRLEAWRGQVLTVLHADRARFEGDGLQLYGYTQNTLDLSALDTPEPSAEAVLRRLVRARNRPASPEQSLFVTTNESYDELITRYSGGGFEDTRSIRQAHQDASDPRLTPRAQREAAALFHRKLAEPLANFTLLLVGVPLAILYGRSRSVAFGLSLVVTLAWYVLLTLGQLLAQAGVVPAGLGVWAGNGVLALFGVYLLYARTRHR